MREAEIIIFVIGGVYIFLNIIALFVIWILQPLESKSIEDSLPLWLGEGNLCL